MWGSRVIADLLRHEAQALIEGSAKTNAETK
jgi:hypothetical protein